MAKFLGLQGADQLLGRGDGKGAGGAAADVGGGAAVLAPLAVGGVGRGGLRRGTLRASASLNPRARPAAFKPWGEDAPLRADCVLLAHTKSAPREALSESLRCLPRRMPVRPRGPGTTFLALARACAARRLSLVQTVTDCTAPCAQGALGFLGGRN